jgi:aspartate racemase
LEETGRNEQMMDIGMKSIGLIGGMRWESSMEYYRIINEAAKRKMGGLRPSKCILYPIDFQQRVKWNDAAAHTIQAGQSLESSGANFPVMCTNAMHKLAEEIRSHVNIPLLPIADLLHITSGSVKPIN